MKLTCSPKVEENMQLTQALKAVRNEALRDDVLGDRTAHWGEVFRCVL